MSIYRDTHYDGATPSDRERGEGVVTKNACQCRICGANADRYGNRFECQRNPCHVADLLTGTFSDLTLPLGDER